MKTKIILSFIVLTITATFTFFTLDYVNAIGNIQHAIIYGKKYTPEYSIMRYDGLCKCIETDYYPETYLILLKYDDNSNSSKYVTDYEYERFYINQQVVARYYVGAYTSRKYDQELE